MVSRAWQVLDDELARWRDAGRSVDFWWRDDDATQWTPALERLVDLAGEMDVPIALAVVPATADPALFDRLGERHADACVLQHGVDHQNRGGDGGKRTEFAATEADADALARIAAGRARLAALAGARALGVFAPPWNRLPATLAARLPETGLHGMSSFGPRAAARPAPGLRQVNTHVDLIDWRGARGFVGVAAALDQAVRHLAARREGGADAGEPTGWLTHHLQHDAAAWRFLEALLERTRSNPQLRWIDAQALFGRGA